MSDGGGVGTPALECEVKVELKSGIGPICPLRCRLDDRLASSASKLSICGIAASSSSWKNLETGEKSLAICSFLLVQLRKKGLQWACLSLFCWSTASSAEFAPGLSVVSSLTWM